jgi:hypothetical protein
VLVVSASSRVLFVPQRLQFLVRLRLKEEGWSKQHQEFGSRIIYTGTALRGYGVYGRRTSTRFPVAVTHFLSLFSVGHCAASRKVAPSIPDEFVMGARLLTTLCASMACYRNTFPLFTVYSSHTGSGAHPVSYTLMPAIRWRGQTRQLSTLHSPLMRG